MRKHTSSSNADAQVFFNSSQVGETVCGKVSGHGDERRDSSTQLFTPGSDKVTNRGESMQEVDG